MSREENLRAVYEQYWLHARHQELQRLTFTSIYGALVAGALAFIGSSISTSSSRFGVALALLVVSLLGFVLCHAWRVPFLWFSRLAEQILLQEFKLEKYRRFYQEQEQFKIKFGGVSDVFHFFYIIMTGIFTFLLLTNMPTGLLGECINWESFSTLIALIVFISLGIIYTLFFKKREKKVLAEIRDRVTSTTT